MMRCQLHGRARSDKRHIILCLLFSAMLLVVLDHGKAHASQTQFLGVVEDMPLMRGLREVKAETLVFDKAEGRIITAIAEGGVMANDIRSFYIDTLPQLGWSRRLQDESPDRLIFEREKERLEITIDTSDARSTLVRFTIEPR